ncbi:magnesium and cobalt efflux protein corC [Ligilactobacillus ceti DSM 22408]|uniref:Magnesium and cobalt efflux protein corC n=1 Tax=Ligilactobacillus ceti DSM 22408 TaxID=1122146 RepID=A0A0R2KSR8_9LACO|nr:magnesium and cobalt efflux protein corC [Ligilactobacillus ceti DSM 22408]
MGALILAAFFVAAEFAIVSVRKSAIETMLENEEGNHRKLKLSLKMVNKMNEYLSTTQVGITLTGIILGWIGADTLAKLLTDIFDLTSFNHTTAVAISAVLGVVILTYLEVVLTEIVPKNISIDMPLKVLMLVVIPLHYFHTLFYPFVWLLNSSANGLVKMFGLQPAGENDDVMSQNEILSVSRNAVHGGAIDKADYLYMQRAFEFNDKIAKDIMVDRTSLEVVDITATVKDVINKYVAEKFTRFPVVANNDKDNILGYVYIYDMIRQAQVDDSVKISKLLRTIISVPEVTPIQTLLKKMIQEQTPIVVVVDEYGGTSGIVTDKDIYEELFGVVKDEVDDVSGEDIIKNADGTYKISGKTTLYDFERYFKYRNKDFQESESVTMAGYLLENYKIKLGSVVQVGPFEIKVTEFNRSYIEWMEVKRLSEDQLTPESSEASTTEE